MPVTCKSAENEYMQRFYEHSIYCAGNQRSSLKEEI
jgi:hypothetical protein